MKRKSRRNWKIKLAEPKVHELAHKLLEKQHTELLVDGYRLMGSSGFWRTKGRGLTARFVYRREGETLTHVIYGIGI